MKRISIIPILVLIAAGGTTFAGTAEEMNEEEKDKPGPAYDLTNSASTLYWEGYKPGGMHHGTVEVVTGDALTDGNMITGGTFEIDLTTIRNDDIGNDGMRNRLVNHLKSKDFFYIEEFPRAYFEIKGVRPVEASAGDVPENSTHMVTGDMTIRGNTHEISFPAEITMEEQMIRAQTGKIKLNRTRWEVNHMSKSVFGGLKDNFINDEMVVKLDLRFDRRTAGQRGQ